MAHLTRPDGEPEPVCANCDSWTDKPLHLCLLIMKETSAVDGCKKFFPDARKWPEADHD